MADLVVECRDIRANIQPIESPNLIWSFLSFRPGRVAGEAIAAPLTLAHPNAFHLASSSPIQFPSMPGVVALVDLKHVKQALDRNACAGSWEQEAGYALTPNLTTPGPVTSPIPLRGKVLVSTSRSAAHQQKTDRLGVHRMATQTRSSYNLPCNPSASVSGTKEPLTRI